MSHVRVRIAPSPTGPIHVGTVRTALFNYLFARSQGGRFILRFEDTDVERSDPRWEQVIIDEMSWLGLEWDEGPDIGGPYGPYRQTERLDLYRAYARRLLENGKAYECFCSQDEIDLERKNAIHRGVAYHYSRRCRNLTEERREALKREGRVPCLRLKVPQEGAVAVEDLIRGRVEFPCKDLGDLIVFRSNGLPVYNFAVVIDDLTMKITHVIRAEEHLSNAPVQVLIYDALGLRSPYYAHVGLVLDSDRRKLSKREGDAFVGDFRNRGYLPDALFNFLALLGWTPEGERELLSREELIRSFSLDRVARNPSVFDVDKLNWMNAQYIRNLPLDELLELALPFLRRAGLVGTAAPGEPSLEGGERKRLEQTLSLVRNDVSCLDQLPGKVAVFLRDDVQMESEGLEVLAAPEVPRVLQRFEQLLMSVAVLDQEQATLILGKLRKELGLGGGKVLRPIRVALTGRVHGPELASLLPLLGKQKILKRLRHALGNLAGGGSRGEPGIVSGKSQPL